MSPHSFIQEEFIECSLCIRHIEINILSRDFGLSQWWNTQVITVYSTMELGLWQGYGSVPLADVLGETIDNHVLRDICFLVKSTYLYNIYTLYIYISPTVCMESDNLTWQWGWGIISGSALSKHSSKTQMVVKVTMEQNIFPLWGPPQCWHMSSFYGPLECKIISKISIITLVQKLKPDSGKWHRKLDGVPLRARHG